MTRPPGRTRTWECTPDAGPGGDRPTTTPKEEVSVLHTDPGVPGDPILRSYPNPFEVVSLTRVLTVVHVPRPAITDGHRPGVLD